MDLLRFTTCGSVDDGKSTLIGRLLYDSKSIFEDQYEAIKTSSEKRGDENVNLALLTDGLRAEREQGITIDVAYRYFATPKRKFIIADTPGHIQYTRNMVTGASTANLAIVLIDARHGIIEQTKRHSYIASLLKIPHLVVCINKMDLVGFDEATFTRIKEDYESMVSSKLDIEDVSFVPISALHGDNVVNRSEKMDWYQGPTLMYLLETIHIAGDRNMVDARFPVQHVIRPHSDEFHDYRGYAGRVAGGIFRKGDNVTILPSGFHSTIKNIHIAEEELDEVFAGQSVSLTLTDNVDVSRGDMIVRENNQPSIDQNIEVMICWFNEKPMSFSTKYLIKHTTRAVKCMIKELRYKVDIDQLTRNNDDKNFNMNDIGRVQIRTISPLFFDSYRMNRITGSFVLIDEGTNETVGAGMIV
jgi:sulfate adenylyltransferase subunit 1